MRIHTDRKQLHGAAIAFVVTILVTIVADRAQPPERVFLKRMPGGQGPHNESPQCGAPNVLLCFAHS